MREVSAERYDEMLGCLPPAIWLAKGFLVGEPYDHRICKITGTLRATYTPLFHHKGRYYEGDPMTVPEFKNFDVNLL